jgi:hypothetical protein
MTVADAAGISMDEGACRCPHRPTATNRHSPTTTNRHQQGTTNRHRPATTNRHQQGITNRHQQGTTSDPWNAGRSSGSIWTMTRDIPRRIRLLKRGTSARRISRSRMGCASRTRDVSPVPVGGRLAHAEPRRRAGFLEPRLTLRAKACATGWAQVAQLELRKPPCAEGRRRR